MPKIIIFKGLPGSGKTTAAKQMLLDDGNAVRVNRDEMRAMLFGDRPWNGKQEKLVTGLERTLAFQVLNCGRNVIVDDTNLRDWASWRDWAEKSPVLWGDSESKPTVEYVDLTNISIETCITRDAMRSGRACVGRGVIERMALENELIDLSPWTRFAIVDIDGTVANIEHRVHYMQSTPKDYLNFFGQVKHDKPIMSVINAVKELSRTGHCIIFLSGRPAYEPKGNINVGKMTDEWLSEFNIPNDFLFMRRGGDYRPDNVVKGELLYLLIDRAKLQWEDIKVVLDDRERVCEVWREQELPLMKVFNGGWVEREKVLDVRTEAALSGIPYNPNKPEDF